MVLGLLPLRKIPPRPCITLNLNVNSKLNRGGGGEFPRGQLSGHHSKLRKWNTNRELLQDLFSNDMKKAIDEN